MAVVISGTTLLIIGLVAAAAAGAGTYAASEAAAKQQRYQEKLAKNQALNAQNAAKIEIENRRERYKRQMASQRAAIGASGVMDQEGSPLFVEMDSAQEAALDLARVKYAGDVRSTTYQSEANLMKWQARTTQRLGYVQTGATLLGGTAKAYGNYGGGTQS